MTVPEPVEIEKDLVRWTRTRWALVILTALAAQGALLFRPDHAVKPASGSKPPLVALAPLTTVSPELIALAEPTLFASANRRGFSGLAWMRKPPWSAPADPGLPSPQFLALQQGIWTRDSEIGSTVTPFVPLPPRPEPSRLTIPNADMPASSRLRWESSGTRALVNSPPLPIQYATDALRASVVEVLVDDGGAVFSYRLLNSSGSKVADAEAESLARKARFEPVGRVQGEGESLTTGKLIFDWYAVDPSLTNAVKR